MTHNLNWSQRRYNNKMSDTVRFAEKMRFQSGFKNIQRLGITDEVRQRVPDRWSGDSEGASSKLGFRCLNNQVVLRRNCGSQLVATLDDWLFDTESGDVWRSNGVQRSVHLKRIDNTIAETAYKGAHIHLGRQDIELKIIKVTLPWWLSTDAIN